MLILMSLFQRSRIWEQLPRHLWMHKVLVRTFTWYIIMCENVKCLCQNLCMFMCRNTYIYIFDCWNLYMSNFTWGTFKLFFNFISLASQDLLKWATNEENRALQDVANQLAELNLVWTEVQREFCGKLMCVYMCVCIYKINHCTLLNMRLSAYVIFYFMLVHKDWLLITISCTKWFSQWCSECLY